MSNVMDIPAGFLQDTHGRLVPESQVREQDKLIDMAVNDLARDAIEINQRLKSFKARALDDIANLIQIAADKYEVVIGGKKGNISLCTYNGRYKVQRVYAERIAFGPELVAASELFTRCIDRWTADASVNIRALVDRAFKANNNGQVKTAELLGLIRLEIDDAEWKRAIEALKDSIQTTGTTVYVRVYERIGDSDKYRQIPLDLASV